MISIMRRLSLMAISASLLFAGSVYGAKPTFMNFQGHQTYVIDKGSGSTIMLIHGLGADSSRFQNNIDVLAQSHRVIAIDLLGFGRSDKPDIAYHIQLFVEQIKAVLDDRAIDKVTLIGNSMGALVSLQFVKQNPERVNGLVLVAPAFVFGLPAEVSAEKLARAAAPSTQDEMTQYLDRIYHRVVSNETIQTELRYKQSIGDSKTIQRVAESLGANLDVFTPQSIASITTPTLLIHGESDGVVPVSLSQKLVELMPDARLVEFSKSGHWPQLEQADMFNEHVLDFVLP